MARCEALVIQRYIKKGGRTHREIMEIGIKLKSEFCEECSGQE